MELIYLLLEDCYRFGEHKEIKLTGEFDFIISKYSKESKTLSLNISKNENHIINYFAPNVSNITGIIGENGSGKTTLLEFIRKLLTNDTMQGEKWLAIFKGQEELKFYHTLYDSSDEKNEAGFFYKNAWNLSINYLKKEVNGGLLSLWGAEQRFTRLQSIENLKNVKTIYYSGLFDLKGYPYRVDPIYVDISTNFLIGEDAAKEEHSLPEKNYLLKHKHKNILRQINLIELNSHLIELDLPVPKEINLIFEFAYLDAEASRDLSSESELFSQHS